MTASASGAMVGREVLALFTEVVRRGVISEPELYRGCEYLATDAPRWIPWQDVRTLYERLESGNRTSVTVTQMGSWIHDSARLAPYYRLFGYFASPRVLYRLVHTWAGPRVFPFIKNRYRESGDGEIEIGLELPDDVPGCRQFFENYVGTLETLPSVMGLGNARMHVEVSDLRLSCRIQPPQSGTIVARMHRWLRSRFAKRHVIDELIGQERRLSAHVRELNEVNRVVDQQRRVAEQALVTKDQFVATMSHELRTPLNGILGASTLLREANEDPDLRQEMLNAVESSARDLLALVEDILNFSTLDGGGVEARPGQFVIREVLARTVEEFRTAADERRVGLTLLADESVPRSAQADHRLLRVVLRKLLSNALKFTPAGHIRVHLSFMDDTLLIAVEDTGIGIAKADQLRIFDLFTQVDASSTRRHRGVGLGLAISAGLARALEGRLELRSELGMGSTFSLRVPVAAPQFARQMTRESQFDALRPRAAMPTGPVRVLVVEDNAINYKVLRRMLERLGCTVDHAVDGAVAVESVATTAYDLVFMDCEMPTMDGFEATRQIRAMAEPINRVPIVATTAYVTAADERRCYAAGMNDFLPKPLDKDLLAALLLTRVPGFAERKHMSA